MKLINLFVITTLFNAAIFAQDYKLLETKSEHPSPVESLTLAPDGKTMITGHHDGNLVFWDLKTRTVIKKVKAHTDQVNTILFNPSGTQFVTSGEDGKVVLLDWPAAKIIKSYSVPVESNSFACLTPDGSAIYFGGHTTSRTMDYTNYVYNKPLGALYRINVGGSDKAEIAYNDERPGDYGSWITDGAVDASGKYVIFTKNGMIFFYDIANKRLSYRMELSHGLNNFTSTKDALFVWGDMFLMKLQNNGGRYSLVKEVKAGTRPSTVGYSKMVLSENGDKLVTGDDGFDVNIWNTNLERLQTLSGHTDIVRNFLFYDHDSTVITAGYDGKVMFWGYEKPPKDTTPVIVDVIFTDNNIPVTIKDRVVELQSTVTVNVSEFDIEVWDQSMVDGDSISLNLNGEWILTEYMVVKTKLKLHVKINPNATNNYLILYAHNLGDFSPNTAAVQVLIGDKKYKLQLSSDLKKSGALNFAYKPE